MTLQEKIKCNEEFLEVTKLKIDTVTKKLHTLKCLTEITKFSELYAELESENPVLLKRSITKNTDYTFELGGDGRFAPDRETRHGNVLTIDNEGVYLTYDQQKQVKYFFTRTVLDNTRIDHVEIKYNYE